MKASICSISCSTEVNDASANDWLCRIANQHSTWLSHEARVGVVEGNVGMALQPGVVLLVGVEIVKDDFEPPVRILSNHVVHEGEKLLAAPTLLVGSLDLTGRHLEGGNSVVVPLRL